MILRDKTNGLTVPDSLFSVSDALSSFLGSLFERCPWEDFFESWSASEPVKVKGRLKIRKERHTLYSGWPQNVQCQFP